jgi:hypothetical protein
MSERITVLAVAVVSGMVFWLAADQIALAQAGSTGGAIGKSDKSASGGEEQSHQKPKARPRNSPAREMPPHSISGKWTWTAKCDDTSNWAGTFELEQSPQGVIAGTAEGNDGSGSMSGQLIANKLIVTRSYPMHSNQIIFTVAAGGTSMQGSESSRTHGICKYQAERS